MLDKLDQLIKQVPALMEDRSRWESLVINRRKPYTYRAFAQIGDYRLCLHRFEGCDPHESFYHPHPWPGAFAIMEGAYRMRLGYSKNRDESPFEAAQMIMVTGSRYEILSPMTWHTVEPLTDVVYTVMVNGAPWSRDVAHSEVKTTKGKDLDAMTPEQLNEHFRAFYNLTRS